MSSQMWMMEIERKGLGYVSVSHKKSIARIHSYTMYIYIITTFTLTKSFIQQQTVGQVDPCPAYGFQDMFPLVYNT